MNVRRELDERLAAALREVSGQGDAAAMVTPAARPEFGDYQANGVMAVAKKLRTNPRQMAQAVADAADLADLAGPLEVAGPGFINIRLADEWIADQLAAPDDDDRLGAEPPERPRTVVVDYSAPNLAKEMHVGHLRSTIIGDALARTLDLLGHNVIRQNHVGDWGTQFGMLTAHMADMDAANDANTAKITRAVRLDDLEAFYQDAKRRFDTDPAFADKSRQYVVRLQAADPDVAAQWERFRNLSLDHAQEIYDRLGVGLTGRDVRGESAYNDDLPAVVADLKRAGLLTESDGAQCVFLDEFKGKDGKPLPVIVQKSDGGYLYATTDLAAIRYRVGERKADRVLYVTDAGQSLHFRQVFAVAREAGFAPESVRLEHVPFGVVQAPGGGKFRTRDGGTVKLMDLLDEAVRRAAAMVEQKDPDMPPERRERLAEMVGIGAVKYADLAQNRASDYVFSFDKMLSLDGNTAPYMQYAYARIRSIFRRSGREKGDKPLFRKRGLSPFSLAEPAERALGMKLLQFAETVQAVADECLPNLLCGYLYDLATAFTRFYETCPVLKADAGVREARLALCDRVARTIRKGLELLGIQTPEQM